MPRRKSEQMTPLELEIMQVLWETGPVTVQIVQRELKRELAYTTVQTMLTVLHRKKKVKRTLKDKAYIYTPSVSRTKFTGHAVREFIDRLFGGGAADLGPRACAEALRDLEAELDAAIRQRSVERLGVRVGDDEVDALDVRAHHVRDCVAARAANADDADPRTKLVDFRPDEIDAHLEILPQAATL